GQPENFGQKIRIERRAKIWFGVNLTVVDFLRQEYMVSLVHYWQFGGGQALVLMEIDQSDNDRGSEEKKKRQAVPGF
ncbi:MAG: hypothetical protein ACOYVF_08435, partial [Candidatus Zixiibacteriota bacterium]